MARFDLTDFEWAVIEPLLPTKPRGVPRVDDRRVLNGIFWRLRTGVPWADIPARYGPHTACANRFNRWRRAGVWDRLLQAVSKAYEALSQFIVGQRRQDGLEQLLCGCAAWMSVNEASPVQIFLEVFRCHPTKFPHPDL